MIQTAAEQRRELVGELVLEPLELELEGGEGGNPPPPAPPDELGERHSWGDGRRREALLMLGLALAFTLLANALVLRAAERFAED